MNPDGRKRINWLCKQIQEEQDQQKFIELVSELNALPERGRALSHSRFGTAGTQGKLSFQ
jgi:hypothetical protein